MPYKPKRPCSWPGCPNLTHGRYCEEHQYSNSSFTEKKTMQNGFDDSGIRMNTWIAKKDKWTLAELKERSEYLMGSACHRI